MALIEISRGKDQEQIGRIADLAFSQLGDFPKLLAKFYSTQGVHTFLAWIDQQVVGFAMLGFLPWSGIRKEKDSWVADILAIAVKPEHREKGIGTQLMEQVFSLVQQMAQWRIICRVELTCPESNLAGLAFFKRWSFELLDSYHGTYSNGQKALRLFRNYP